MSEGLLRITAVAGGRRSDLAVPGGVAVAELLPDLARAVGLLDPAAVYAGYRLHAHGRRLQPDRGLREQGVDDGALLAVAAAAEDVAPVVHDDLVDATAEAVDRQQAWRPADTRRTTLAAGLVALVLGTAVGLAEVVPRATAGWSLPGPWEPAAVAAVALTLVVLLGHALPAVAVAVGIGRADREPVDDEEKVASLVARSLRFLVAGSVVVGLLVALGVPFVARSPAGVALAGDCAVVLLLRARRPRARVQVLTDTAGGLCGLLLTVLVVLVRHPDQRPMAAALVVVAGLAACVISRLPPAPRVLRARALDLLEMVALVALAPLLLLAVDGPALTRTVM